MIPGVVVVVVVVVVAVVVVADVVLHVDVGVAVVKQAFAFSCASLGFDVISFEPTLCSVASSPSFLQ